MINYWTVTCKFKIDKITYSKLQSRAMYDISKNKPLLYPEMLIKIHISKCSQPTKYWCVSKIHTLPSFQNANNCNLQFLLFLVIPVTNCTAYYWVLFFQFWNCCYLSYFQCIASFWVWVQFYGELYLLSYCISFSHYLLALQNQLNHLSSV